jgi:hypothetical protein
MTPGIRGERRVQTTEAVHADRRNTRLSARQPHMTKQPMITDALLSRQWLRAAGMLGAAALVDGVVAKRFSHDRVRLAALDALVASIQQERVSRMADEVGTDVGTLVDEFRRWYAAESARPPQGRKLTRSPRSRKAPQRRTAR